MSRVAFGCLLIIFSGFFALNSAAEAETINARSGRTTQIANLTGWDKNCRGTGYAEVVILKKPTYGVVAVKRRRSVAIPRRATTGNTGRCAGRKVPGMIVDYRSNRGYQGWDSVVFKARPANSNRFYRFRARIRVR